MTVISKNYNASLSIRPRCFRDICMGCFGVFYIFFGGVLGKVEHTIKRSWIRLWVGSLSRGYYLD